MTDENQNPVTIEQALDQIQSWINAGETQKAKEGLQEVLSEQTQNERAKTMLASLETSSQPPTPAINLSAPQSETPTPDAGQETTAPATAPSIDLGTPQSNDPNASQMQNEAQASAPNNDHSFSLDLNTENNSTAPANDAPLFATAPNIDLGSPQPAEQSANANQEMPAQATTPSIDLSAPPSETPTPDAGQETTAPATAPSIDLSAPPSETPTPDAGQETTAQATAPSIDLSASQSETPTPNAGQETAAQATAPNIDLSAPPSETPAPDAGQETTAPATAPNIDLGIHQAPNQDSSDQSTSPKLDLSAPEANPLTENTETQNPNTETGQKPEAEMTVSSELQEAEKRLSTDLPTTEPPDINKKKILMKALIPLVIAVLLAVGIYFGYKTFFTNSGTENETTENQPIISDSSEILNGESTEPESNAETNANNNTEAEYKVILASILPENELLEHITSTHFPDIFTYFENNNNNEISKFIKTTNFRGAEKAIQHILLAENGFQAAYLLENEVDEEELKQFADASIESKNGIKIVNRAPDTEEINNEENQALFEKWVKLINEDNLETLIVSDPQITQAPIDNIFSVPFTEENPLSSEKYIERLKSGTEAFAETAQVIKDFMQTGTFSAFAGKQNTDGGFVILLATNAQESQETNIKTIENAILNFYKYFYTIPEKEMSIETQTDGDLKNFRLEITKVGLSQIDIDNSKGKPDKTESTSETETKAKEAEKPKVKVKRPTHKSADETNEETENTNTATNSESDTENSSVTLEDPL